MRVNAGRFAVLPLAAAAFSVTALVACATTNVTRLSTMQRPVVATESVQVFLSADKVPGKYEEVALLNSKQPVGFRNGEDKMYNNMKFKAGQLGANGIILNAVSEPGTGAKVANALLGTGADRKGKAVAIYIFPDSSKKH